MNTFWTVLTSSLGAFALNRLFDYVASHRAAVARLRSMLLDLNKCEELAREYLEQSSPKAPAYRLPTELMEQCLNWFAGTSKLGEPEMRALHDVVIAANEVNRCLDLVTEVRGKDIPDGPLPAGLRKTQAVSSEINRSRLKCEIVLERAPKVREAASIALERLTLWREFD
jgi:hypothetical protein